MRLCLLYTRRQLAETFRTPVLPLSITLMPVLVMLFFIMPYMGHDPRETTGSTAIMVVFAALMACVGHFSLTIAVSRASSWGSYVRTLPVGMGPQVVAHLVTGAVTVIAGVIPIVVVAGLFTTAAATFTQVLAALAALLVAVIGFSIMGIALGYTMSLQAVLIVNSIGIIALAVGGGMFTDPFNPPALIEAIAPYFPTRGATDLVLAALIGFTPDPLALLMLGVWTAALAGLAVWAYRRDQGRRFQ